MTPHASPVDGGAGEWGAIRLDSPLPGELAGEFLAKLHYVSEALASFELTAADRVAFRLRPGREADAPAVAAGIAEVARQMAAGWRPVEKRVLADRSDRPVPWTDDPHPALAARGELFELGRGRYGFGPALTGLIERLDRLTGELAAPLGAVPHRFPALVTAGVLDRTRYLRSFPHALTLACHLREDLDAIRGFAAAAACDADGRLPAPAGALAPSEALLAPTVCFHWYGLLADRRLEGPRAITATGRCFRWESGNLAGLERLWDFTMRELVFAGPAEVVLERRERTIAAAVALFDRLGLAFTVESATDPFFIEGFSLQRGFQAAFELKWELRARLPYRDRPEGPGSVAAGSFNYHQDFFGRSLAIEGAGGEPVHTVCVGFGLERLALAVAAQYGPDPAGWPEALR